MVGSLRSRSKSRNYCFELELMTRIHLELISNLNILNFPGAILLWHKLIIGVVYNGTA
jgi:hypothetical protein